MIKSLFPKTKRKVLSLMFLHPDDRFYLREIVRRIDVSLGTLHRELKPLVKDGILNSESKGNQTYYSVNRNCPIYAELRGIIIKTFGIVDVLKKALKKHGNKIKVAFIYGSIATGEENAGSDIDLFVVGRETFGNISVALSQYEESLGREINVYAQTPQEFKNKLKEKNHFVNSVLKSEKIYLIGSEDDVRKLG